MDAIASTIGSLVVDQVQAQSVGKTSTTGNGSMSALYGAGGDVANLLAQSGYSADAGKQFAWSANAQFTPVASSFDATAASLGLTPDDARRLIAADNGASIVGSPFSPAVTGHAVPYPQISVSVLPEGPVGTIRNLNGFESFMAFNPVGQALGGATDRVSAMANGLWNVVAHPVDTADAIGAHYGNAYAAGTLGDTVLGDVGSVLTGAVKSSPVGLLDAMYHQDQAGAAYRMGGAAIDAALFAGPSLAGPALETSAGLFGPKLAGWTESYLAKAGGLSYVTEPSLTFGGTATGLDRLVPGSEFVTGLELPATSINSADALARKFGALQDAQINAAKTINVGDGRTLYFSEEVPARTLGPTRGASLVTEFNATTSSVRQYYESYDHMGAAIRVHPKMINGQVVDSWHYPPTGKELGR